MRQVVLDTETTGIGDGHRILEIGCLEIVERKLTGRKFHVYINPERESDAGALAVHGITQQWLEEQNAPVFSKIADEFRQFIDGAQLVIHNAKFDTAYMNYEFRRLGLSDTSSISTVLDTMLLARQMFPGSKHSLDALCRRFDIDNKHRELHGALLDAELLAEVYLAMTGGQIGLSLDVEKNNTENKVTIDLSSINLSEIRLPIITATAAELEEHERFLDLIDKKSEQAVWRKENLL